MRRARAFERARLLGLAIFLVGIAACGTDSPLDTLAQGETGRVVRIIDGDALVLDTGLSVRLVGIEAPVTEWRARNRDAEPFADEAKRMLEDMALGRQVQLVYPGVTRDRYDRALAYVRTNDNLGPELWLNEEMIRLGGARARIYPDTSRLGDTLIKLELGARARQVGLWALEAWTVKGASELIPDARGFHIVTAQLTTTVDPTDPDAVCARQLADSAFIASILTNASELCDMSSGDWQAGTRVRLRGYLRESQLEISHIFNAEKMGAEPETF